MNYEQIKSLNSSYILFVPYIKAALVSQTQSDVVVWSFC